MMKKLIGILLLIALGWFAYSNLFSSKPEEIYFRHSLNGDLAKALEEVVEQFNQKNPNYKVVLDFGGDYKTSFTKTFEDNTAKKPHLLMVAEFNTITMQQRVNDYIPLHKLLEVDSSNFVPVIKEFYTFKDDNGKGSLYSLPFNCSTAILFYNKDIFKKVGLPDRAPETWEEMEQYAEKLKEKGYTAFTTAWPAAYIFEHFSSVHNIPYATGRNGLEDNHPKLLVNSEPFIKQLEHFADWAKKGFYVYGSRKVENAEEKFVKQECAMILQGANRLFAYKDKGFEVGVGTYPYWKKMVSGEPYALNVCGTSIWILNNHPSYEGVKVFLKYLASEPAQTFWHQRTGYLPVTLAAYEKTKISGFYDKNPAAYMAVKQLVERMKHNLPGIRIPDYADIREKVMEAIENVLLNNKPAKQVLDQLAETVNRN